jgi:hypothetical protein
MLRFDFSFALKSPFIIVVVCCTDEKCPESGMTGKSGYKRISNGYKKISINVTAVKQT